jgi:hypothetical protein
VSFSKMQRDDRDLAPADRNELGSTLECLPAGGTRSAAECERTAFPGGSSPIGYITFVRAQKEVTLGASVEKK